jgi:ring-1,2-phenylacetyl-CoA epoxidase subunit PaaC
MNGNINNNSSQVSSTNGAALFLYTLHLADSALMMAQRNSEWTGHGPVLEQDIAITNIALDHLGQAKNFYDYAAGLYNGFSEAEKQSVDHFIPHVWKSYSRGLQEDDLAFLRDEHQYLNLLLTELPKGDWAQSILRQYFFSAFQILQFQQLQQSSDTQLAAIAAKSIKETQYHLRWSSEWVVRLGDGTEESNHRIKHALDELWMFTGEMFTPAAYEQKLFHANIGVDVLQLKEPWLEKIANVFQEATLQVPASSWMQSGGKQGKHTEHMGFLLAEMQYLQRAYPNSVW